LLLLMRGHRTVHEPSATVLTEAPDTVSGLRRQRIRWATGKTQVILRIARSALSKHGKMTLIWLYMAWNNSVLPLLSLPSAVLFPLSAGAIVLRGGPGLLSAVGVVTISLLTIAMNYAHFAVSRRFARSIDAEGRAAAGLAEVSAGFRSTVVIPVVAALATWVAWLRILTGRSGAWDKLDRSGDVQALPGPLVTNGARDGT
jgi:hypothetical protein